MLETPIKWSFFASKKLKNQGKSLEEVLLSRYELFSKTMSLRAQVRSLTHTITNLNAQELEERYGNRVRSRMRQLFILIAFDRGIADKRK